MLPPQESVSCPGNARNPLLPPATDLSEHPPRHATGIVHGSDGGDGIRRLSHSVAARQLPQLALDDRSRSRSIGRGSIRGLSTGFARTKHRGRDPPVAVTGAFAATWRSRRRAHWCSSPRLVVTTYAAINRSARTSSSALAAGGDVAGGEPPSRRNRGAHGVDVGRHVAVTAASRSASRTWRPRRPAPSSAPRDPRRPRRG
jgi:hypothetical protein